MSLLAMSAVLLGASCATHSARPVANAKPVPEYVFPIDLPDQTSVCVVAYRPQLVVGCISLKRLRTIAFDLEAD